MSEGVSSSTSQTFRLNVSGYAIVNALALSQASALCYNAIPLLHQPPGSTCHFAYVPSQQNHPSPSTPNPMPLKGLIMTGSINQSPPFAISSTSNGPVTKNHACTHTKLTIHLNDHGVRPARPTRLVTFRAAISTKMPTGCSAKNKNGPVQGFVSPGCVLLPDA